MAKKAKLNNLEVTGVLVSGVDYGWGGRPARHSPITLFDYDQGGLDPDDDRGDDQDNSPSNDLPAPMPRRAWESYRGGEATDGRPRSRQPAGRQADALQADALQADALQADALQGDAPRTRGPKRGRGRGGNWRGPAAQPRTWGDVEASPTGRLDSFTGDFAFLSNFYLQPFQMGGKTYRSGEHAYQALKMTTASDHDLVRSVLHPYTAKQVARTLPIHPRWDEFRVQAMSMVLQAKFGGDRQMKGMLLATRDWTLVEGTDGWGDTFWGQTFGQGENHLGKELMALRATWRREPGWGGANVALGGQVRLERSIL